MKTQQQLAAELAESFEIKTRVNGDSYHAFKDDWPKWFSMHYAHNALDGRLPNDWIYETVAHIADSLTRYDDLNAAYDIPENLVDSSTYNLLMWAAEHGGNQELVNEVMEEEPALSIHDILANGQRRAIDRLTVDVVNQIAAAFDNQDEEEAIR